MPSSGSQHRPRGTHLVAADYVIGDVQGCYEPLQRLLEAIDFNEHTDRLWFVGDLVNRGPDSLAVLRFIQQLPLKPWITLGNHDLHLLGRIFTKTTPASADDTLDAILNAPDVEDIGHWLRHQALLHHDESLNVVICHAGIAPLWNLQEAKTYAHELETILQGPHWIDFLTHMYGNQPHRWSPQLTGYERLRVICNYFTRMRFCDADGGLMFHHKGRIDDAPTQLFPWFNLPQRQPIETDIVFGHWAALMGFSPHPTIHSIDTGCLWGGTLTSLRLQDRQRFSVHGLKNSAGVM